MKDSIGQELNIGDKAFWFSGTHYLNYHIVEIAKFGKNIGIIVKFTKRFDYTGKSYIWLEPHVDYLNYISYTVGGRLLKISDEQYSLVGHNVSG